MSTDDTVKIAASYDVKVVKNKKVSIATGRNLGFAKASGELIAFTDADCIVDKNWISHSIKYFDDPLVAGVSGPIHTPLDQDNRLCACGYGNNDHWMVVRFFKGTDSPYTRTKGKTIETIVLPVVRSSRSHKLT